MVIIITIRELMDKHLWLKVCDLKGLNAWSVNAYDTDKIELTETEAIQLGLI